MSVRCIPSSLVVVLALAGCAEGTTGGAGGEVSDGGLPPSDGGTCIPEPDPAEGGNSCTEAISLGTLSDAAGDSVTVSGNALPTNREIWWSFLATDDTDTDGDEFHVDVRFLTNPQDGYHMAVYRGTCSSESLVSDPEEKESFDWYTDFPTTDVGCTFENEAPCGEGDCAPAPGEEGRNICDDDTTMFYVLITRTDDDSSCEGFEVEMSNGRLAADG